MRFGPDVLAPGMECVVEHQSVPELLVIVAEGMGEAEGDREESGRRRRDRSRCPVSAARTMDAISARAGSSSP